MGILTDFDEAWRGMLGALGVSKEAAAPMKAEVLARYGEPGRAYHNLSHALRVWADVMQHAADAGVRDTGAVQTAALLHDVIYDTQRQDNEALSAEFAVQWGRKLGIAPPVVDRTAKIILATQKHGPTDAVDIGLVLDADLAILAASPEEYDAYRAAIRREYAWVTEQDWTMGRGRVLAAFLEREQIYHGLSYQRKLEAAARGKYQAGTGGAVKTSLEAAQAGWLAVETAATSPQSPPARTKHSEFS